MPRKRFSEEQIAHALRMAEAGTPVAEVCRQLGTSQATFFRWKKRYAGMGIAELRRLKQLEEENRKLKQPMWRTNRHRAVFPGVMSLAACSLCLQHLQASCSGDTAAKMLRRP